jgi:tetratricopeptide (TPR) repeat protein
LQRDSNNDSLFFWKGQTLHQLERFADAISCFDRAIELNSQNEAAYLQKMGSLQLLQLDGFDPCLL